MAMKCGKRMAGRCSDKCSEASGANGTRLPQDEAVQCLKLEHYTLKSSLSSGVPNPRLYFCAFYIDCQDRLPNGLVRLYYADLVDVSTCTSGAKKSAIGT